MLVGRVASIEAGAVSHRVVVFVVYLSYKNNTREETELT